MHTEERPRDFLDWVLNDSIPFRMINKKIGYKIIMVVGLVTAIALFFTGWFYSSYQETSILRQNQRTMEKLTESVIQGLRTIMLVGYADVAQAFADRLKEVEEVRDFRILRTDGLEAFRDNKTIYAVNKRRGEELFIPREEEEKYPVFLPEHKELSRVLETGKTISFREISSDGEHNLTFLAPIRNEKECKKCHGSDHEFRGILKFTASLEPVQKDIDDTREIAFIIMLVALLMILSIVAIVLFRTVVRPIDQVTEAMKKISAGDLSHQVPVFGKDEISRMAGSFNLMSSELRQTYDGLRSEQDKLSTIILSAREGIVVTDKDHKIVLINPAAQNLLGKTAEELMEQGFLNLIDDPTKMESWLFSERDKQEPELVEFNGLMLSIYAATIQGTEDQTMGSAALIRDVTEEKRLEEELRRLSTTDSLTGLFNRRYLDISLKKEIQRAKRYKKPISLMMFDVDHFKKFNDAHGHDQGDRVLQAIAEAMRACLRKPDIPCRFGGEEFVSILPETTIEGALIVAERLRKHIEGMVIDGLAVTVSIGVAGMPPTQDLTAGQLIEAADKALYFAKDSGRNQVRRAA